MLWISFGFSVGFKTLSSKPKSIEKDFYIYLYMQNHKISKKNAKRLFKNIKHLNKKLKNEFAKYDIVKKSIHKVYKKPDYCFDMKEFVKVPPYRFLKVFSHLSIWHIERYLNTPISANYLQRLAKYSLFNSFVKKVLSSNANNLKASLKGIKSFHTKAEASFYLALFNLENKSLATFYLFRAKKKAISQFKKDRATLWLYLISKDKKYLRLLTNSTELNIYSLYAYENLQKTFANILTSFNPTKNKPSFDTTNPLSWAKTRIKTYKKLSHLSYKQKIYYLNKTFKTKKSEPHLSFFLKDIKPNNYFLLYHMKDLQNYSKKRQALLLAIARQESQFIPTAISPSFALGLMQFMPFLVTHTAKKLGLNNFKYRDIFNPKIAYRFANDHLDYLEKHLYNPLLVAYAYNGGIGYTKRNILQKNYFKLNSYEPFYSLEMITPREPMHYAKKVLANYVVYCNLLGVPITETELLERLKDIDNNYSF